MKRSMSTCSWCVIHSKPEASDLAVEDLVADDM